MWVVLWGVEHPGNLGAIARLCANFEVEGLVLVEPKCSPGDGEAKNRAKHAQQVLAGARVLAPEELRDEFDLVVGTTAQVGTDFNVPRSPLTPEQFAKKARVKGQVALVFGSEGTGLTNEQLDACDFVVSIPAGSQYPTLNLSHAVAIMLYELFAHKGVPRHELVLRAELEKMYEFLDRIIDSLDFTTEVKRETQRVVWRKVLAKALLTRREANAMLGLLRKLIEYNE